jgi:uncharacterized protein YdhG (YjbR/CyaY superfamily)
MIDTYISQFPAATQQKLKKIRHTIKKAAPNAIESMAYNMPAYKTNGKPLVYFAAFKNHIGLYALPSGHEKFAKELAQFKQGKGSVQFPLTQPIPYNLIEKIVKFRLKENEIKLPTT